MDTSKSSSLKQKLATSSSSLRLKSLENPASRGSGRGGAAAGRGRGRNQGRGRGRGGPPIRLNSYSSRNNIPSPTTFLLETNDKINMPVCTFYLSKRCNFGVNCRFYHPDCNSETFTESQKQQQTMQTNNVYTTANSNTNTTNNGSFRSSSFKAPREFDAFKAEAINMAKAAQDLEINKYAIVTGPFYSMDIECVAVGYGHSDKQRYPCRVSLVKGIEEDQNEVDILVDEIVNLNGVEVASYMTALTGMTAEQCLDDTRKCLDDIVRVVLMMVLR